MFEVFELDVCLMVNNFCLDAPNTKFAMNGRIVLGQLAEIHADNYKDGNKQSLFHILVHLDEGQFLKPDFAHNKDNIIAAMVNKISPIFRVIQVILPIDVFINLYS